MQGFVSLHALTGFLQLNYAESAFWDRSGASGRSTFLFLDDDGTVSRTGYVEVNNGLLVERVEALVAS
jgi:hypothetical protein